MSSAIVICVLAFFAVVWVLRAAGPYASLGLPAAYMLMLLMIHVPGAAVHALPWSEFAESEFTQAGIHLTAVGAVAFVVGVALARLKAKSSYQKARQRETNGQFLLFCLILGWCAVFLLSALIQVPSLTAVIEKGGAVWMLGVMLGLRASLGRHLGWTIFWTAAMCLYPVVMLLIGGFLGYGFASIIICLAPLAVSVRSRLRTAIGVIVVVLLGFNLFLSYFQNRDEIRTTVWGQAGFGARLQAAELMLQDLHWFNPHNQADLESVDERLNQNYFVGLSASQIDSGAVDSLRGRSVSEGVMALVPRIVWPEKPVFAGSPGVVMEMTGLKLSETTSWGIGQVMEFYINFGMPSLVIGFLLFGWLIARLDLNAALAIQAGDVGKAFRCFLPAVALIGPQWSIVELASGAAAAFCRVIALELGLAAMEPKKPNSIGSTGFAAQIRTPTVNKAVLGIAARFGCEFFSSRHSTIQNGSLAARH